jgi:hypothetical protein
LTATVVGYVILTLIGLLFAVLGAAMVANPRRFGERVIEDWMPKMLRSGTVDANRRILGWSYAVLGSVFAVIGLAKVLAAH